MGGGKSVALCGEGIQLSLDVPGNRGAIIRRNRTTLKRTTLVTFFQVCPPELIRDYNQSELKITLINGSEILCIEADETKDPLFEKLKSLEIGWFAIDEASEVVRDAFAILGSRLRWKAAAGKYYGLLASNPEQCWIKDDFIDKGLYSFFPALPKDNPFLPADYLDNLRLVFDDNQQKKYIEGDWNASDDPLQIIPYTSLKNCIATDEEIRDAKGIEHLGIDPAELGSDKAVFAYMRDACCYQLEDFSKLRIDELSNVAIARIADKAIRSDLVGVDAVGNGAGVWGNLTGANLEVRRVIAGEAPDDGVMPEFKFANLKAQMWWQLRQDVMKTDTDFKIPNHQKLIQDLTAPRYRIASERKIEVESKDDLKRRLGRSPDYGEALVIANWMRHSSNGVLVW